MCQGDSIPAPNGHMLRAAARACLTQCPCNTATFSALADVQPQMPILWIRGDKDVMVSASQCLRCGGIGANGSSARLSRSGSIPSQPMVEQMRYVLERYRAVGGRYEEQRLISGSGHGCMLDHEDRVVALLQQFIL